MDRLKYALYLSASMIYISLFSINAHSQICPPPDRILGNDTLICPDGALYLNAGEAVSYLWSDGSTASSLLVTLPGQYMVTITDECDKSYTDTIIIGMAENPTFAINLPVQDYFCKGDIVNLVAEAIEPSSNIDYEWLSNASTNASILVDSTGDYAVVATNEYGCQTTKDVSVEFQFPYEEDKILLSSYSVEDDKYFVVWRTTPEKRSKDYTVVSGIALNNLFDARSFNETNL
ncbi:MAG: hypothetical protein K9H12_03945, partial [Bacteroidales bacterium]|nr:hypothetical protein [Bacteroidales bacterium]